MLHRIISEVQRRYDVADQRRSYRIKALDFTPVYVRGLATRPRTRIHGLSHGEGILRSAREGLPAAMAFAENDHSEKDLVLASPLHQRQGWRLVAQRAEDFFTQGKQSVKAGLPTEAIGDGSRSRPAPRRRFMRASSRRSSPASVFR